MIPRLVIAGLQYHKTTHLQEGEGAALFGDEIRQNSRYLVRLGRATFVR